MVLVPLIIKLSILGLEYEMLTLYSSLFFLDISITKNAIFILQFCYISIETNFFFFFYQFLVEFPQILVAKKQAYFWLIFCFINISIKLIIPIKDTILPAFFQEA